MAVWIKQEPISAFSAKYRCSGCGYYVDVDEGLWLACIAMNKAFGIEADRFTVFAEKLDGVTDWYEGLKKGADEDYANEKLRQEAERVSGMKIDHIHEDEMKEAARKYETE